MNKNSVLYKLRKVTKLLSATVFITVCTFLIISSCKKQPPNNIGLDLIKEDLLHSGFTDTSAIITHTIKSDSLTLPFSISPVLIGSYTDPVLGNIQSSFYGQLSPGNTVAFGKITKQKFDSVVLSIAYMKSDTITPNFYGIFSDKLQFSVYELTEKLSADSTYYSNTTKAYNSVALGSKVVKNWTPLLQLDSFKTKKGKFAPQVRIRLPNLESRFYSDTSKLLTKELFQDYFKGVYIKAELQDKTGALYAFNPVNSQTRLTIYYNDSLTKEFLFYGQGRFNNYKHDYSNAPKVKEQITTADNIQQTEVYIQGLAGLKTKIYFTGLNALKNKNIALNKAELVLKLDPSSIKTYFPPPANLIAYKKGDDGLLRALNIGLGQGIGTYDKNKKEYRINLSYHLQQILKGAIKDNGVELMSGTPYITPAQLIFGGAGTNSPIKMKLELTYTVL